MKPDLARRVAITGVGVIGSFGSGTGALWNCVDGGGAKLARSTRYPGALPCAEAARPDLRRTLRSRRVSRMSLVSQFAIAAVHPALAQAGLLSGKGTVERVAGMVYGTSNGPAAATRTIHDDLHECGPAAVKPRVFQESVFNAPASLASIQFGLTGPIQVLATSTCAPSVLYQAQILLARSDVAVVIALCADELCEAVQSALRVVRWHAPQAGSGTPSPPVPGTGSSPVGGRRGAGPRTRRRCARPGRGFAGGDGRSRFHQRCLEAGATGAGRSRTGCRDQWMPRRCRGVTGRRRRDPVRLGQHRCRRVPGSRGGSIGLRGRCATGGLPRRAISVMRWESRQC